MHSQCKYILVTSVLNQISKQLKFGLKIIKYESTWNGFYVKAQVKDTAY